MKNILKEMNQYSGSVIAHDCGLHLSNIINCHIIQNDNLVIGWIKYNNNFFMDECMLELMDVDKSLNYINLLCDKYNEKIKLNTEKSKVVVTIDNTEITNNVRTYCRNQLESDLKISLKNYNDGLYGYEKLEQRIKSISLRYVNSIFKLCDVMKIQYNALSNIIEFKI